MSEVRHHPGPKSMHLGDAAYSALGIEHMPHGWRFTDAAARLKSRLEERAYPAPVVDQELAHLRASCDRAEALCESYIEKLLLPWLLIAEFQPGAYHHIAVALPKEPVLPNGTLVLVPQAPAHRRRIDFALFVRRSAFDVRRFAIECDGAEYHDVRADVQRDAALASWGIQTIRLRGSEIFRNPEEAAASVVAAVQEVML